MHEEIEFREGTWYKVIYDNNSNFNEISKEVIKSESNLKLEKLEARIIELEKK